MTRSRCAWSKGTTSLIVIDGAALFSVGLSRVTLQLAIRRVPAPGEAWQVSAHLARYGLRAGGRRAAGGNTTLGVSRGPSAWLGARSACPLPAELLIPPPSPPTPQDARSRGEGAPPPNPLRLQCSTLPGQNFLDFFFPILPLFPPLLPPFPSGRVPCSPTHPSGRRAGRSGGRSFQEITSPRCPGTGSGLRTRAAAPAAVVPMWTSKEPAAPEPEDKKKANFCHPAEEKHHAL